MKYLEACQFLQISTNATKEEAKQAYRRLAQIYHPDKGGDIDEFKSLTIAYKIFIKNHPFMHRTASTGSTFKHSDIRYSENTVSPEFKKAVESYSNEFQEKEKKRKQNSRRGTILIFALTLVVYLIYVGKLHTIWILAIPTTIFLFALISQNVRLWISSFIDTLCKILELIPSTILLLILALISLLIWENFAPIEIPLKP